MRRRLFACAFAVALAWIAPAHSESFMPAPPPASFSPFLKELWPDAQAKGITRATFDSAFKGLTPDPRVTAITHRQPEYGKPFGGYVASMVSQSRITNGKRKAAETTEILDAVEKQFGVDRYIILAIWGIETSYGGVKDRWDVIRSLATLAQARWRHPYFRDELITALQILQEGHIDRKSMLGSWAGAMGQTQFMPTNFFDYAIDFTGDGRRDIWNSLPDVLASTGNYLHKTGWNPAMSWGYEVAVPVGFDHKRSRGSFREWSELGVRCADGAPLPQTGDAILFFPSGAEGPAFLVTENFVVIKRYNNSDAYALAVGHLADRLRGLGPIRGEWPSGDRQLSMPERVALQKKLAELGYKVRNFTGHFDFDLRDAIRDLQVKFAMTPDGHPNAALLDRLGVK